MKLEWFQTTPPTYFNHFCDLYYQWPEKNNYQWLERGVFNAFYIRPNNSVLELCAGDGFNARYFYSIKAKKVIAIDIEPDAIKHATQYNSNHNTTFICVDVLQCNFSEQFDNIIIDAALEQFNSEQQSIVIDKIYKLLNANGFFSGCTISRSSHISYKHNKYEFSDKDDLYEFLNKKFENIRIIESNINEKKYLYFCAQKLR